MFVALRACSWLSRDALPMPRPDSSVVERGPEKAGVGGSIPSLATTLESTACRHNLETASDLQESSAKLSTYNTSGLALSHRRLRPSPSTQGTFRIAQRRAIHIGSAASASSTSTSCETARTRRYQRRRGPGRKRRIGHRRSGIAGIPSNRSCVSWGSFNKPRSWERSRSLTPSIAG